jgi:UDP-3-O-[3-hydroxymyristoyl] glucosamine N-acyltransferase
MSIHVSDLASHLGVVWTGADVEIVGVAPFEQAGVGVLCFAERTCKAPAGSVVINGYPTSGAAAWICAPNPREAFERAERFLERVAGLRADVAAGAADQNLNTAAG